MDDCPHSGIPSEPNSAFSYPGVSWYHPGLLFRMKQPRTVLLFCTDWFLLLNVSPFNFIKFPKHRPKTWLVWEKNGQASGDVGSTCTPIKFHSLYCSPPRAGQWRTPPAVPQKQETFPPAHTGLGLKPWCRSWCEHLNWSPELRENFLTAVSTSDISVLVSSLVYISCLHCT